ncbi:hypothetical protein [Mesorhizobium sp. CN2-181]|uniref:hypothetical protein n=1 Tax=Mesorhizobium yinganensis TaxID=3157707 RepID=UPI0032B8321F
MPQALLALPGIIAAGGIGGAVSGTFFGGSALVAGVINIGFSVGTSAGAKLVRR